MPECPLLKIDNKRVLIKQRQYKYNPGVMRLIGLMCILCYYTFHVFMHYQLSDDNISSAKSANFFVRRSQQICFSSADVSTSVVHQQCQQVFQQRCQQICSCQRSNSKMKIMPEQLDSASPTCNGNDVSCGRRAMFIHSRFSPCCLDYLFLLPHKNGFDPINWL